MIFLRKTGTIKTGSTSTAPTFTQSRTDLRRERRRRTQAVGTLSPGLPRCARSDARAGELRVPVAHSPSLSNYLPPSAPHQPTAYTVRYTIPTQEANALVRCRLLRSHEFS
ncbi:hypothetical protein EVAR_7250_1 [Eumeta japonica]|uniref:Uncharacterized protein n=1 Tax=Eumeta variegata TaxID=151549 RepID=A0A4C1T371_EUMVA|nr:hypothetical protein EVAR_7250_1 [Eumeta japonica]